MSSNLFEQASIKALLALVSKALFGVEISIDASTLSLEELHKESVEQSVSVIALDAITPEIANLDKSVFEAWNNQSIGIFTSNINMLKCEAELHRILSENGIPACTVKGYAVGLLYPKNYLRQMGDVDFMIPLEELEHTEKVLIDNGYVKVEYHHDFHTCFQKNGILFECHTNIHKFNNEQRQIEGWALETVETAIDKETEFGKLKIPDTFHNGLILLLHAQRHFENGLGIGLRHLCDWACFVNSIPNDEFKEIFEEKLKKAGLWKFARVWAQVAVRYLNMPYKEWLGEEETRLVELFMYEILESGNFGRKESTRNHSSIFVSEDTKKHFMLVTVIKSLNKRIGEWNHFYEKYKWLLPVGYVCYTARAAALVISGRKKVRVRETIARGSERSELFDGLDFFDKES